MEKKYYLQVYFTKDQKKWLKEQSQKKGLSMGGILKIFIEKEMKKKKS